MACTVLAYIAMACMVMACIVMAYIVMAYIVMACIVIAYVVMAYIVMATGLRRGLYTYQWALSIHSYIAAAYFSFWPR